jgi:hypothetical protein
MWNWNRSIDRAGDWNAQFFREVKGRCTPLNLTVTGVLSIVLQLLLMFGSLALCNVRMDGLGKMTTDWSHWWENIFYGLTWTIPVVLVTIGTYLLASDLYREKMRGTLNFIRLSPQSGLNIMVGKFLGVPILVYFFVLLAAPLQVWAGSHSKVGFFNTLLWDGMTISISGFLLLLTIFWMTLAPIRPIAVTGLHLFLVWIFAYTTRPTILGLLENHQHSQSIDYSDSLYFQFNWFYLPINNIPTLSLLCMGTILVASYWLWEPINRRYANHHSTLLSKRSSYQLNLCLQLWLIGFVFMSFTAHQSALQSLLVAVGVVQIVGAWFFLIVLTPSRRILQDWSRYHRERVHKRWRWGSSDLVQDLLWDDRSPAILAVAINLGISLVPWLPFVWKASASGQFNALLSIVLGVIIMFNYGLLFQIMAVRNSYTIFGISVFSMFWVVVIAMLFTMLTFLAIAGFSNIVPFTIFCLTPLAIFNSMVVPSTVLLLAIFGHLLAGWFLMSHFQRYLQTLGRSESAIQASY